MPFGDFPGHWRPDEVQFRGDGGRVVGRCVARGAGPDEGRVREHHPGAAAAHGHRRLRLAAGRGQVQARHRDSRPPQLGNDGRSRRWRHFRRRRHPQQHEPPRKFIERQKGLIRVHYLFFTCFVRFLGFRGGFW